MSSSPTTRPDTHAPTAPRGPPHHHPPQPQQQEQQQQQHQQLSPLEQQVLNEYARLLANLDTLADQLGWLAAHPSPQVLEGLRGLERSASLVYTLLKASVYSIVLNLEDERA